ncbi:pilus assembly protein [Methylosinus sporium]|uniref:Pilus assembly protein n=1 Tax=Methylosinus sporium TaxID=428 RepID=A0A549SRH9_METSR|nr:MULTISPECIES: TadE/TadG family type IV pilus assembly protein [Methylosinus]MBU3886977.1 pilus assembly protein [Methylosinus sp. KRF6]TRL32221.1 pilus assembly protein [Methylosinus sporium]
MHCLSRFFSRACRRARDGARTLRRDEGGMIAVEFALLIPIAVLILVAEFTLGEAIGISRKVAITGRTLTDLVARRAVVSSADLTTILNASTQIIAPFPSANLKIVLAQLSTDDKGKTTTVEWNEPFNTTGLVDKSTFVLPAGMAQAGTWLIYAEVRYDYTPPFGAKLIPAVPIRYTFYINPRITSSVQRVN